MEDESSKLPADLPENQKSFAGIPEATFVEDVDAFMALPENGGQVELVLKKLDETHSKYKFMEYNLASKRRRLRSQIPELERALDMLSKLQEQKKSKQEIETKFLLSEQVYAKAIVPPTEKVCLWLGANIMLEYNLDEAEDLMVKNIETAKLKLRHVEYDLDFIRDQFTTTEVNMARVYNWNVKKSQPTKAT